MGLLAGYLRVSHVGKRGDRLRSPEEQAAEIERWAAAHGHRVEFLPPELDAKGSDAGRQVFRQAIDGVKAGRYSGLVVAYLSRAGRDLRLMLDLWDEVESAGGVVYSARENVEGSTAAGKLHRNLLASIAQHELEERREGFERATQGAVERGIWQRRQTPRGYSKGEDRRLVVNEDAASVRSAARDYLGGKTLTAIARDLGMTPGGVRAMLRNRVYLGELKVRSYVNEDAHEAILDPETFEAVQARLAKAPRPARGGGKMVLLAGLVRCAGCGHVMTRATSNGGIAYSCVRNHSGVRCPEPAAIMAERIDRYVEAVALAQLDRLEVDAATAGDLTSLQDELRVAESDLSGYLQAVDVAGIGAPDAAAGMRSRRERVDAARDDLRAAMARAPQVPKLRGGREGWARLSRSEQNELLRSLLAVVIVRRVQGATVPVAERVRVLRFGADIELPRGRTGSPSGIVPLPWPDPDGVDVLGVSGVEEAF